MFRWFLRWRRLRLLDLPEDATKRERRLGEKVVELEGELQGSSDQIDRLEHDLGVATSENELLTMVIERNRRRVEAEITEAELKSALLLPSNQPRRK